MSMSINNAVNTVLAQQQASTQNQVQISVLRKALDIQSSNATQLIEALPKPQAVEPGSPGQIIDVKA